MLMKAIPTPFSLGWVSPSQPIATTLSVDFAGWSL